MATVKETEIVELEAELTIVNTSIENVMKGGQSFQKGGRTGFATTQASLAELLSRKRELKAKLAMWGVYDG